MGTSSINCCEISKETNKSNKVEIETNFTNSLSGNDKIFKTAKTSISSVLNPKLYLDEKTKKIIRIQSLLRAFLVKSKFKRRLKYQTKNLIDFFKDDDLICPVNNINEYVSSSIINVENQIKSKEGVFSNPKVANSIFKPYSYNSFYSIEMPCVYLNDKEESCKYSNDNTKASDIISNKDSNILVSNTVVTNNNNNNNIKKNKSVYKGYWNINKKKNGYGILIKSDSSKYEGFFRNGKLDGPGRYITITGDYFEGNFSNGVAKGYGIFIHSDGSIYKGNWIDDMPSGEGEEWTNDGSYYRGDFYKGKKCGIGEFKWTDGSVYLGGVKEDLLNGEGIYTWNNGKRYKGMWINNEMHGKGTLYNIDQSKYIGDFYHNKKEGYGVYYYSNNKYYEGYWLNGKQHGKGKLVKNGEIEEYIWEEGKKLKKLTS